MYVFIYIHIYGTNFVVYLLSHVWLFAIPWPVACQVPLFMDFSRQEYWNGLPFPSPRDWTQVSFLVGRFFTVQVTREAQIPQRKSRSSNNLFLIPLTETPYSPPWYVFSLHVRSNKPRFLLQVCSCWSLAKKY